MIDRDVLQQLGWSDRLIDALNQAAEPLRRSVKTEDISAPVSKVQVLSTTAIYSNSAANNTFRTFIVSSED